MKLFKAAMIFCVGALLLAFSLQRAEADGNPFFTGSNPPPDINYGSGFPAPPSMPGAARPPSPFGPVPPVTTPDPAPKQDPAIGNGGTVPGSEPEPAVAEPSKGCNTTAKRFISGILEGIETPVKIDIDLSIIVEHRNAEAEK